MNEMRKLMEAINAINEGDVAAELALNELKAAMDAWHNAITKFQGIYDPSTVGLDGWMESNFDTMFDLESELDDPMDEAYQGGKTEHSGAKKGEGAFYGRKKEAKRDSNKNSRRADKSAVSEEPGDSDHGYNYEGPQAGEYGDFESGEDAVYDYGVVRAKLMFNDGEVTLTHGHGENIFLTIDEWNEFVGELKDT